MFKLFLLKRLISELSEEEFFQKLDLHLAKWGLGPEGTKELQKSHGRLVYGLRGIQDLFGCSHKTAQHLKDHVICQAVSQHGRKIVIDSDLALKLFNEKQSKNVR